MAGWTAVPKQLALPTLLTCRQVPVKALQFLCSSLEDLEMDGVGIVWKLSEVSCISLSGFSGEGQFSTSHSCTENKTSHSALDVNLDWNSPLNYFHQLESPLRAKQQKVQKHLRWRIACPVGRPSWMGCSIVHIYGSELNPQGKSEQGIGCFSPKASGCKSYFASNRGVYGHVLLETCCFSQRFLSDCLSKTASGNDKHAAVNLKSSVQP